MQEIPEHARKTLEDLRRQYDAQAAKARKLLEMVNAVEAAYQLPPTPLSEFTPDDTQSDMEHEDSSGIRTAQARASGGASVRPDEFLGLGPLEAAKAYLEKVGHAVDIEQIAEAISKGGAAVGGANWRSVLEMSLTRAVREVVKVREGTFGLVRFYTKEQIERLRVARRPRPQSKKKRKAAKRVGGAANGPRPVQPKRETRPQGGNGTTSER